MRIESTLIAPAAPGRTRQLILASTRESWVDISSLHPAIIRVSGIFRYRNGIVQDKPTAVRIDRLANDV